MGFFSKIRKRIKKIIPKEIRPFVPYMAAMIPGAGAAMGLGNLAPWMQKAIISGATRGITDDEADLKDIGITAALAAAPDALGEYAKTGNAAQLSAGDPGFLTQQAKLGAAKLSGMAADKPFTTLATQGGIDAGIKAAELNEDALERYNRELLEQGIADKASRRSAIRAIYEGTGTWDMGEVDEMLDTYGYRTGGRVPYELGEMVKPPSIHKKYKKKKGKKVFDKKKKRWVDLPEGKEFFDSLDAAKEGYDKLEEQNTIKPLPIRELRLASGGDVDDEVMEFDEEIITPDYLMKEEGVEIGEQVSSPDKMDELNSLSMDLFGKPLGELNEIQMEMLMNFASQKASAYTQDELDMYEQYKYDMNEQMPGMPIMEIDDFLRMELGAARMGVKKGGPIKVIELMPKGVIYKGKAKDYPGIKQLIKDMKKKGTRKGKAEGGLMNLGGNEMDLRGGGFVPMGAKERADDVPARLSKNEFVFTADAVRAAGGGSVDKGADLMYDTMKKLEAQV